MRHPEFEAALSQARRTPELWRLLLGMLLCLFVYLTTAISVFAVATGIVAAQEGPFAVMPFVQGIAQPDTPGKVMALLLTFTGMALGPVLAAGALHGRGPVSLLGPSRLWVRGFVAALAAVLVIYLPLTLLGLRLAPPEPGLPLMRWLSLLPLMVPMLFLQIFAEEVLFRGYLQQQLAARFVARWIWIGIPSVLFALLHISPIAGANLPIVLLGVLTFAFLAADLAERTGSLGASMGLHFGNNFFGLFILATKGTITGAALFVSQSPQDRVGWESLAVAAAIPVLLAAWWLTRKLLRV